MAGVISALGSRPVAARLGCSLFLGGAFVTLVAMLLPHPAEVQEGGYVVIAAFQVLVAAALLTLPMGRVDAWQPWFVAVSGILVVTAAVYMNGERFGGPPLFNEFFYVWPALYAGYFFRATALKSAVALTGIAHAGVLAAIGLDVGHAVTRWLITFSVVAGVALAAHALRRHVDKLVWRLREAMRTDLLTSVLNRRGFEEAFGVELQRLGRTGSPLSVVIGDVDAFKALNDRFGHAAGDAALKAVAGALRGGCRAVDVVARIGGEEFAILMPATRVKDAVATADRLRAAVSANTDPDGVPLTISFGVVTCTDPADADPDRLLRHADAALYAAKASGRDRSVAHADAPVSA
jgi:diguanylate cyclase (GGDEF)-like protein